MFYENEIVMLVFGFLVTVFIGLKYKHLIHIRYHKILLAGFYTLLIAWICSTIEEFILEIYINLCEHALYAASALLLLLWIYKAMIDKTRNN
ncbi:MAG: hypothetical protein JW956_07485 [Calditrichaceae bacterium]|nr:hypothetical protein [Calditrichaceae bacterium]